MFVQVSQRYGRLAIGEYVDIFGRHAAILHELQNCVAHPVVARFADETHRYACPCQ